MPQRRQTIRSSPAARSHASLLLTTLGESLSADCAALVFVEGHSSVGSLLLSTPDPCSRTAGPPPGWTEELTSPGHAAWICQPSAGGNGYSSLRSVAWRDKIGAVLIELRRSGGKAPFDDSDVHTLARVAPGVAMALQVSMRAPLASFAEEVFESLPFGLALVDGARRLTSPNSTMRRILSRADGLLLLEQKLRAQHSEDDVRLGDELCAVAEGEKSCGDLLTFSRPGQVPQRYLAIIERARVSHMGTGRHDHPLCKIAVLDPGEVHPDCVSRVASRFHFTAAETRVMLSMLSETNLQACADQLNISPHTLRWHIKRLTAKTGTSGRTALVLLFVRSVFLCGNTA